MRSSSINRVLTVLLRVIGVIQFFIIITLVLDGFLFGRMTVLVDCIFSEPYSKRPNPPALFQVFCCFTISIGVAFYQLLKIMFLALGLHLNKTGLLRVSEALDFINGYLMLIFLISFYTSDKKEESNIFLKQILDIIDIQQKYIHSFGIVLSMTSQVFISRFRKLMVIRSEEQIREDPLLAVKS